jgi:asparagine synthetase B (glutamine-hydrolysing)
MNYVVTRMTTIMARRGPDAGDVWIDRHAGIGHRRLAVIDLAGGAQPMQAEEQGRTIASLSHSGEVYNFVELRKELKQLGHPFKTRSDTEVVLRGYLQWGDKVAERLNGMFAFAIWDVRTEEKRRYWMLTAREHAGDLPRTIRTVSELLCSLLSGGLDSSAITALAQRAVGVRQGKRLRSFSVDFANHGADFQPSEFHRSSDTPFVRDFVAHTGVDHTEIVLESRELADPHLSRTVVQASDFPRGIPPGVARINKLH